MSERDHDKQVARKLRQSGMTRRQALKLGGAAVAGMAWAGYHTPGLRAAEKTVRIGVVGGGFGAQFPWHEHPNCEVTAVSDLREDRRAILRDRYQCDNVYNSLAELVKDPDVDAVAVFTDAPLHVPHAVECLEHGKHVISAVPACYATVEDGERLLAKVEETGLTYMMAETSYYQQFTISARKFYEDGDFGTVFYAESEYQHSGLDSLYFDAEGNPTWRHGMAPMHYPTHCTAHMVGVTGQRLTEVVCHGWGDDDPILQDNAHNNPFWNESAMFKTENGHGFRVNIWWKGAHRGTERAEWIGDKMSFYAPHPNGLGPILIHGAREEESDDAGFVRHAQQMEAYKQPHWWATDMLPEALRYDSGHEGSHNFLVHEFIDALVQERQPTVNVYEALNYTIPGIIAHESALKGGELLKIPQYAPRA